MKKNNNKKGNGKLLRLASVLLAVTLVTSVLVGNTISKYITTGTGSPASANVAKWGVQVTATTPNLFADSYDLATAVEDPSGNAITESVKSTTGEVVAPGTASGAVAMPIGLSGTPETAVSVTYKLSQTNNIKIDAGTSVNAVTLDNAYTPIVWTLYDKDGAAITAAGNTVESINTYLSANPQYYGAGTDLSTISSNNAYKIGWAWEYNGSPATVQDTLTTDDADTFLGNAVVTPVTGANTTMDLTVSATVTQQGPSSNLN